MAGILDTARFRHFLSQALNISAKDIHALVLGGHGDTMVPLLRYVSISGVPLLELVKSGLLSESELNAIVDRTRNGGGEIVSLLKTGSAFYAPASSALEMAEAYLYNQRRLLPCAAYLNGEYHLKDMYVGVPIIIGKKGVEKIIELPLTAEEKALFDRSAQAVKSLLKEVEVYL